MNATYQNLLQRWATLAPDECLKTDRDYKFKVKILPSVEKRNSLHAWRMVSSASIEWRLSTGTGLALTQLNFLLLTLINHCAIRHENICFTFADSEVIATICNGLRSQPQPHSAIAALDAYVQLLEF